VKRRAFLAAPVLALAACKRTPKKVVAVIPKATSHVFWVTVQAGCLAACQEFNLELLWNGPTTETEYTRQVQIVDSMVARRVDGLAVAATDRRALLAPVERATLAGIPVTIFDSGLDTDRYMSFVATDNLEAGRMAARKLADLLNFKGDIAILMNAPGSISSMDREDGFREVMEKDYPNIHIVAEQFGMAERSTARAAAENILTAHPKLDGFFASTEPSSMGVLLALKARDLARQVRFVAFDANDDMIEDLRKGLLDAIVVQDPFKMGYETVKTLAEKIAGRTPPRRIDLHARIVTDRNLDDPEIQRIINPDLKKYIK